MLPPVLFDVFPDAPFPDPREADDEGLVAVGGKLTRERLLDAYRHGIFPWYDEGLPVLWWSPDQRAVFLPGQVHVSRSLARTMRNSDFEITWNQQFEMVMRACGDERAEGTWVTEDMVEAYVGLHDHGDAFSLEVWAGEELAGGIYGVHCGALFAAESMFHRYTDASKIALVHFVERLGRAGVQLVDVQMPTDHLASMGAQTLSRRDYLAQLPGLVDRSVSLPTG